MNISLGPWRVSLSIDLRTVQRAPASATGNVASRITTLIGRPMTGPSVGFRYVSVEALN